MQEWEQSPEWLVAKYDKLAWKLAHKALRWSQKNYCAFDLEDLHQLALTGLVLCAKDFTHDGRAKFSTFAYACMSNYIRNEITRTKFNKNRRGSDGSLTKNPIERTIEPFEFNEEYNLSEDLYWQLQLDTAGLTEKQKQSVVLWTLGYRESDIKEMLGISGATYYESRNIGLRKMGYDKSGTY